MQVRYFLSFTYGASSDVSHGGFFIKYWVMTRMRSDRPRSLADAAKLTQLEDIHVLTREIKCFSNISSRRFKRHDGAAADG
jgi:hypothetical protein